MQRISGRITALTAFLTIGLGMAAGADEGHKHGAPLHGGDVVMTDEYHFEVVFLKDGLRVFPRTHDDKPLDVSGMTGTATFFHPNSPKPWFEQPLKPVTDNPDHSAGAIGLRINLSKVPVKGAKVEFQINGLPEAAEPTSKFTVPFVPPAAPRAITFAKATKADEAAIAEQQVCKVSGEDLFAMGGPVKVSRGDKSTFICCNGCLKQIQANPDKYLGPATTETPTSEAPHDHAK